jgi:acetylornithine deacetylase
LIRVLYHPDPFKLTIEGDELHGRGTTDCLGHCALQTNLFVQLAKHKPYLGGLRVVGVLIANEEAGGDGTSDVGVEALQKHGHLDNLSTGPVIWLDCANKQPNIGSGGVVGWQLTATGRMFHSGFPHKGINAIELATDGMNLVRTQAATLIRDAIGRSDASGTHVSVATTCSFARDSTGIL